VFPLLANRYQLLERIGSGGMGVVWSARDELLRREVAVKEVLPAHSDRIEHEAQIAARVSHPHVVTVYDLFYEQGRPWLVMELVRSRALSAVITDEGPLPVQQVAHIGHQVLSGLAAVHAQGILHCDIKPGNVLLDEHTRAHLTDFGIAADTGTSGDGKKIFGAPAYIAPERARGLPIGPASDLWSLGATLYTAVEGHAPLDRGDPLATMTAVVMEDVEPPRRAGRLTPLLNDLLDRDPERRPGFDEVDRRLREAADEPDTIVIRQRVSGDLRPRTAVVDPAPTNVAPAVRRRPPFALAGGLLAAAAAVVAVPLFGFTSDPGRGDSPVPAISTPAPAPVDAATEVPPPTPEAAAPVEPVEAPAPVARTEALTTTTEAPAPAPVEEPVAPPEPEPTSVGTTTPETSSASVEPEPSTEPTTPPVEETSVPDATSAPASEDPLG
jgi:hypothetical protein